MNEKEFLDLLEKCGAEILIPQKSSAKFNKKLGAKLRISGYYSIKYRNMPLYYSENKLNYILWFVDESQKNLNVLNSYARKGS